MGDYYGGGCAKMPVMVGAEIFCYRSLRALELSSPGSCMRLRGPGRSGPVSF